MNGLHFNGTNGIEQFEYEWNKCDIKIGKVQ